jgi:hypothetical protein
MFEKELFELLSGTAVVDDIDIRELDLVCTERTDVCISRTTMNACAIMTDVSNQ